MSRRFRMISIVAVIAAAIAVMISVSACGGSSKPKYCSDVSGLKQAVGDLDASKLGAVKSQLQKVSSQADQLIASAKSDFPQQTSDIKSALTRLRGAGEKAIFSPSPSSLAAVVTDGKALVDAINTFSSDTKSKCS